MDRWLHVFAVVDHAVLRDRRRRDRSGRDRARTDAESRGARRRHAPAQCRRTVRRAAHHVLHRTGGARMTRPVVASAIALVALASIAQAQAPTVAAPSPIRDNSFLIEEAYNQPWGVVQHVSTFQRVRGAFGWGATFTQEWPAPSERHQLSYTVPIQRSPTLTGLHTGIGDVMLNYRYQIPFRSPSPVAIGSAGIDAASAIPT